MYYLKKSNTALGKTIIVTLGFGHLVYDLIFHPVKSLRLIFKNVGWY